MNERTEAYRASVETFVRNYGKALAYADDVRRTVMDSLYSKYLITYQARDEVRDTLMRALHLGDVSYADYKQYMRRLKKKIKYVSFRRGGLYR